MTFQQYAALALVTLIGACAGDVGDGADPRDVPSYSAAGGAAVVPVDVAGMGAAGAGATSAPTVPSDAGAKVDTSAAGTGAAGNASAGASAAGTSAPIAGTGAAAGAGGASSTPTAGTSAANGGAGGAVAPPTAGTGAAGASGAGVAGVIPTVKCFFTAVGGYATCAPSARGPDWILSWDVDVGNALPAQTSCFAGARPCVVGSACRIDNVGIGAHGGETIDGVCQ